MVSDFRRIAPDAALTHWAEAAHRAAVQALATTDQPLRCGGTWAVGLDLLPNAPDGSVDGVALPWGSLGLPPCPLHKAQLSTVFPGYPQPSADETEAAFAFRKTRDAAHLDGLLPIGSDRRRMVKEPHGFILGIALTDSAPDAAPLTVWDGSAAMIRSALQAALAPYPPETWGDQDITAAYQAARAEVFRTCPRVPVPMKKGEAVWMHRLTIHGVAPWADGALAPPEGRIIAYFRPVLASVQDWLTLP